MNLPSASFMKPSSLSLVSGYLCTPLKKKVLNTMNISPAQLHPNSWAFLRAFHILCDQFGILPNPNMLFFFFEFKTCKRTSWASLSSVKDRAILTLFQSSYKSFKGKFVKVLQSDQNPSLLERVPLYWSSHPHTQTACSPDDLATNELNDCEKLDGLGLVFDTSILLNLKSRPNDLQVYIGTYFRRPFALCY